MEDQTLIMIRRQAKQAINFDHIKPQHWLLLQYKKIE